MKSDRVVQFVIQTAWRNLPSEAQHQARRCLLDTLGALIAGTQAPVAAMMADLAASQYGGAQATILVSGRNVSAVGAAMANGFAANALDLDDGHRLVKGHPGSCLLPALLAAAEQGEAIRGADFLTAFIVGYEVAIRAGLIRHALYTPMHSSGSWGAIGAAAASGKLMGLDSIRLKQALGIAEHHAPVTPVMKAVDTPCMAKDGVGWGAMVGMASALMAERGFTGIEPLFSESPEAGWIDNLGEQFEVMRLYFKPYACCRWTQPAIVGALAALNPSLPIGLQMAEVVITHQHLSAAAARSRCVEMLQRVDISDAERVLRRYPHQLSGGMQQRVVIAMALLLRPSLLIMDEPTTGLDVTIQAAVLDLVNELRQEFGTAILFISHNLGVIAGLCDRVGVMYAGEMVEEADIRSLFQAPKHPYTIGLLRCIPRLNASKETYSLWSIPGRVPPLNALPPGCIFAARCPMARHECREHTPELQQVGDGRRSRCLFWDKIDPAVFDAQPLEVVSAPQAVGAVRGAELLEVKDLRVYFRQNEGMFSFWAKKKQVSAVDGVTFSVPARSTLSIVGESGCGKSTIARTIAGLTPLTGGQIRFENHDLNTLVRKRQVSTLQSLQMVFQNPDSTLNPQKTVADELRRPLRLFRVVAREQEDGAIEQLLQAVGLDGSYGQRYPAQLSGGEKQRVAIARAFAGRPQLVLCDEPTSSLDVSVQSMVLNLLLRLQQGYGVSLLFISHDLSLVRYMSDYVAIVYLGKICEIGRVDEVFRPPYHPYTEALLSAVPIADPAAQRTRIRLQGSIPSPVDPPRGCPFHTRCPRKVGPVCEQVAPPAQQQAGHVIYCHIPLAELSQLPPILPV